MSSPWCSTAIRSESPITAAITCSITMMDTPASRMPRITSTVSSTSVGVRPDITSSRSSTRGSVASARASSSRFRSPMESACAGRPARGARRVSARTSRARRRATAAERVRLKAPTMTFSTTDSSGKGWTSWKVRASPRRQIACGGSPVISCPSSLTLPPSGRTKPVTAANNVVLPAPLGPMRPRISPWARDRLTSDSAWSPPKRLDRERTSMSVMVRRAPPRRPRGSGALPSPRAGGRRRPP